MHSDNGRVRNSDMHSGDLKVGLYSNMSQRVTNGHLSKYHVLSKLDEKRE